mmetsp:Transcript_15611/g.45064  ORF Transcript_15611/g.45064 Transcript_15611/m.45064 type:complete len:93 (+) Transcript_15611:337-615(+)
MMRWTLTGKRKAKSPKKQEVMTMLHPKEMARKKRRKRKERKKKPRMLLLRKYEAFQLGLNEEKYSMLSRQGEDGVINLNVGSNVKFHHYIQD